MYCKPLSMVGFLEESFEQFMRNSEEFLMEFLDIFVECLPGKSLEGGVSEFSATTPKMFSGRIFGAFSEEIHRKLPNGLHRENYEEILIGISEGLFARIFE